MIWLTFCNVEIEEVAIKNSLYTSCYNCNQVKESLEVVAVDPVHDVQATVRAKSKQVVACYCLRLTGLADHEELGQDGHRLQVDGKGPQDLHKETKLKRNMTFQENE